MARTARICVLAGCPEIITAGKYCEEHTIKKSGWESSTRSSKTPPGWARTRASILHNSNYTCRYCGASASEVDHVIPLSQGGKHNASNLVAACSSCNRSKNYAERIGKTWTPPNKPSTT